MGRVELAGWCGKRKTEPSNANAVISPLSLDSWKLLYPSSNPHHVEEQPLFRVFFHFVTHLLPVLQLDFGSKDANLFCLRKKNGFPCSASLTLASQQNPLMTERLLTIKQAEIFLCCHFKTVCVRIVSEFNYIIKNTSADAPVTSRLVCSESNRIPFHIWNRWLLVSLFVAPPTTPQPPPYWTFHIYTCFFFLFWNLNYFPLLKITTT